MTYNLYLQTSAIQDIREAHDWYELQKAGLGNTFLAAVGETLIQIEQNPLLFVKVHKEKRRAVLQKFPYNIIFAIEEDLIRVSAVVHGKQDPQKWQTKRS